MSFFDDIGLLILLFRVCTYTWNIFNDESSDFFNHCFRSLTFLLYFFATAFFAFTFRKMIIEKSFAIKYP